MHRVLRLCGYFVLGTLGICCAGAVIFPVFAKARIGGGPGCIGNIRQLVHASLMYSEDYGTLPSASVWMDSLTLYERGDRVFHCPEVSRENRFEYGYAMRSRLSRADLTKIKNPAHEALIFDSWPLGRNAHTDAATIPGFSRHGGQNIGYADGSAKRIRMSQAAKLG